LCGARLDGRAVVLDGLTEQPRQRSRQCDKVFLVRRGDGVPADIYHVEVQVQRTEDFQERMVAYSPKPGTGLEQGHVDGMRALLRATYGDLADLARRLADRDHDGNIARIGAGAALAELRS
jgi:hypothetical protein